MTLRFRAIPSARGAAHYSLLARRGLCWALRNVHIRYILSTEGAAHKGHSVSGTHFGEMHTLL
jgi:hypothetical protein